MELEKRHLLFGCEIMKFFSTGLLLLIVFGSLEGSTIPHKRTVRALNATIQTHFNGTIQRTNPCTNKEVERSSYRGCHEFHHHSKESNWSDYSRKCATLISDFFQAISNLVSFKDRQSGTFDLNINTKVSHKTDGSCAETKKPICPTPTVIVESTDCEVLPSTSHNDLPGKDTHSKGSEICSLEEAVKVDEREKEKCSPGSVMSVNEEPQTLAKPSDKTIPELQPAERVSPPEIKPQSEEFQPETIPAYDNIITSAPKEDLYTDSARQETLSESKDYVPDYKSQTDEDKTEIQPSSSVTQPDYSNDNSVPEPEGQTIEFSDKLAVYNVHGPQQESAQTFSPSTQHYYSDTTTPSPFDIKSDYDVQDIPVNAQPTTPPQYQSDSYDEPIQSSHGVTFAPVQPEPDNYVNQYNQVASDLPTSSPANEVDPSLEYSDQPAIYNVRQPQPESPSSSSLLNEPTSLQPPVSPESHSENYVNYEDGLLPNQPPTSVSPPKGEEPSLEFSDQLAVYNVRQPYFEPTSIQPTSSESQVDNYDSYEDKAESTESTASPSSSVNEEPSLEFSDELAVYNIHGPTTAYPPSPVSQTELSSIQPSVSLQTQPANYMNYEDETVEKQSPTFPPSEEPSVEYSDQLAVYNVREPLPGTTTPYPLGQSSIQPSSSQSDAYMNYETEITSNQVPSTSSPQPEDTQYLEYSDQLAVYNVREPLPGTTTPYPLVQSSIQPSSPQSDNYLNYETEVNSNQTPTTSFPQPEDTQYLEYSDQLAVYNVREPLPGTTTSFPVAESSIEPSSSQSDINESSEEEVISQPLTTSSPKLGEDQYVEYSDQLAVYNVREPLPGTTTLSPIVESSIQPSSSQSDNYMNYETEVTSSQVPSTSSPQPEDNQYLEYSDQLAVYNVREPLPGTTTSFPVAESSIEPYSLQSDVSESSEDEVISQPPTTPSPKLGEDQYVEYSDQLAVYNVREALSSTTSTPTENGNIPSSFATTPLPSFSSYELDTYDSQKTEVEPQPTFAPMFEEVTGQPQPSNEPASKYDGEYNKQLLWNQMSPWTTPAGSVYPTSMPSSEYIDNNGPESASSDYSSSEESSEAQQNQVFSDQVSELREPQSDSSVSDGPISDMVTAISPIAESETSIPYDDGSSLRDSQQTLPSELQQETTITNEYPESSSSNQLSPHNYEIYDEQSSTSENEAQITSTNKPITYQQYPIDAITTSPSSTETENFGFYDDSNFPAEPQGTYPPKIESGFANEDNDTSTTGQAFVSIEPLSNNASSENEPVSSEEGSSSQEEDGNDTVGDDQGLLPLSSNTFRPTAQIETTVNYPDQTPFRPIRLPSSIGPLQENNIIYDEGILGNETEPSAFGGEETVNSLNVSSELTEQNEGKEFDSSTTLTPQLNFDTYYEETFMQPPSSDAPKINNNMNYEDDVQPSLPKFDLNTTISNDYSLPSTQSLPQETITTPSTTEAMPETYTDYEYTKTDFNSQTTFPPQTESVIYDDHSSQDQSLPQQQVDYAAYDNQIQSTASPNPADQEMIEISDQLSIYNVPETALESSPTLSELFLSKMVTTTQPSIPSDGKNLENEFQPTFSPSVEPQNYDEERYNQPSPSKDLNLDTYINYEDTISLNQSPTTSLPPNEVDPSLEYSDQPAIYNVRQPQPESPPSSSLLNELTSLQPPALLESHSENYVNYEDGLVQNQLPTSVSPPKGEEPSLEFSDQLAVYNVRQPYLEPTSTQPTSPESQVDNYDSYEDKTESTESTASPSSSVNEEPSLEFSDEDIYNVHPQSQFSSPSPQWDENIPRLTISTLSPFNMLDGPVSAQPTSFETEQESEEDYEDDIVSSTLPSPKEKPSIELSDEVAIYNVRQPSTAYPPPSVNYLESSSLQPTVAPQSQPDNYVSYDDEGFSNQVPTTSSPQPEDTQYLEYSDQLAVYNVREPLPGTTTPYPLVQSSIQPSSPQSDNYMNYETEVVSNQIPTTSSPQAEQEQYVEYSDQLAVYNVREPLPGTTTSSPIVESSIQPSSSQSDINESSEEEVISQAPTTSSPRLGEDQYVEYSDQLAVYNVREPLSSTTTSTPIENENIPSSFATTLPPPFLSSNIETYDEQTVGKELQPTIAPEMYDERTSAPATSLSPTETQPESYVNYESGELPTSAFPPKSVEPFLEYSDQLSISNVRQPEFYSSSTPPVNENLVTTIPNLPFEDFGTNDNPAQDMNSQLTSSLESESQMYDEPTSSPASFAPQSDVYTNYDDKISSNEFTTSYPPHAVEPSLEISSHLDSSSIAPASSSLKEEDPFLQYSDQLSIYNARQPSFERTSSTSPLEIEDVSSGAEPVSSVESFPSQVTYDDYTVQKEELSSTPSTLNSAQSQDFSVPPSNYSAEQEFDYQATSPPQSQDNYIAYEDPNISNALTTSSPLGKVEPSLEYSDQFAVYNVREPVFESTVAPVVSITTILPSSLQPESQSDSYEEYEDEIGSNKPSTTRSPPAQTDPSVEYTDQLAAFNGLGPALVPISVPFVEENIPSDVTTSLPPSLNDEPTSPQTSTESQSDSVEDYENETVSAPSPVAGDEPSVELSDDLSIYNVRKRPSQMSSLAPLSDNITAEAVTAFAPYIPSDNFESYDYQPVGYETQPTSPGGESPIHNQPVSVPNTSSQLQDNYVNYDHEIESNAPMTTLRPPIDVEYSDDVTIYNVHSPFTPSSSASPLLNENIAVDSVSTFMPAPLYDEATSAPSTSSEEQPDNYINYEDLNKFPITYPPSKEEPPIISADQLAVNSVRENIPNSIVTTLSPSSTESQSDSDDDYEDESNESTTTPSTPVRDEPSVELSEELAVYNVREPLPGTTTPYPLVQSSIQPSYPQSDNYINYETEVTSNQIPSTSSPQPEDTQYLEYSDQLAVYNVREPLPGTTTSSPIVESSIQPSSPQSDNYMNYEAEVVPNQIPTTSSPQPEQEQYVEYSDQPGNVVTTLSPFSSLSKAPVSIQPSSSESQSDSDDDYEDESNEPTTTPSTPVRVEPSVELSEELAVYNAREPLPGTTTPYPLFQSSIQPSSPQSDAYMNYETEVTSNQVPTTSSPQPEQEQYVEYSDQLAVYNVREPLPGTTTSSPIVESSIQPSSSQSDVSENYEDEVISQPPTTSSPQPEQEQYVEYSDQLAVYNVREPLTGTTFSSPVVETSTQPSPPVVSENIATTLSPSSSLSAGPVSIQPSSSESQSDSDDDYEDESNESPTTLSIPVEPSVELSDELAIYKARQPEYSSSPSPLNKMVTTPSHPSDGFGTYDNQVLYTDYQPTFLPQSDSQINGEPTLSSVFSESKPDNYVNYEDEFESNQASSSLSPPVKADLTAEYSDQLEVYNVHQPHFEPTSPPVVSENIPRSMITTLSPSSLIADETSPQSSSSFEAQADSNEEYEDEAVSTPSPVSGGEPSLELSDELSIYNVRQRPSEMSTPSPFNNNVINNLMTTISPFFTFKESSSEDNLNTATQTTESPEYVSDMYDEKSSIQPSKFNEDNSQSLSDETTFEDSLPETLNSFADQTVSNVIQSTQSPDLSNQVYGKNEVESQETGFVAVQPNVEPSDLSYESGQEFDYPSTLPSDYETPETKTIPPSSLEYPNQIAVDNTLPPETSASYFTSTPPFLHDSNTTPPSSEVITETYADYEGTTANFNSPPTQYDEPRNQDQVQVPTSPQPQIVNYDYYNDQNQKPEESWTSPPTTEIDTDITLTEVGPTLPPNFESQMFDKGYSTQPNYVDYENSVVSNQTPTSPSPQREAQPSIELSDQLDVYNVRQPYFEPTSFSSEPQPQPDNYDTYEDEVIVNEPSTPQKVTQPTPTPERKTQMYNETTLPSATSEPQSEQYENYEDDRTSTPFQTSTSSTNQVEPSVEYSDDLAVYNVREPTFEPTSPPLVSENVLRNLATTLSPTSSLSVEPVSVQPSSSELQSDSDDDYEDESNESPTTPSTPIQVQPSVELSDELAVYNVREPLSGTTISSLIAESSIQPSSPQSDNYVNYESEVTSDQTPTTSSPQPEQEQYVEYSDQLAVYNVREPLLEATSPPVISENTPNSIVTTLSPSSSESQSDGDDDYEDESNDSSTTPSTPVQVEPSVELSEELAVYNVREPLPGTTTPYPLVQSSIQPSSPQSDNYMNYETEVVSNQLPTTSSPQAEQEQYVEYSDQLAVYNVREPLPGTTTSSPIVESSIQPSSQSDSYMNYETEVVSNQTPTTSSPQPEQEQYVEYSDQPGNVVTTLLPSSSLSKEPLSIQPSSSESQSEDVDYEDESNESSTTLSTPVQADPSAEYSDQLEVYNVHQPHFEPTSPLVVSENIPRSMTTTLSPSSLIAEETSPQSSSSFEAQADSNEEYEDETVSSTPSPVTGVEPSLELSDELSIYNVRQRPSEMSTPSPFNNNVINSLMTTISPFFTSSSDDNKGSTIQSSVTFEPEAEVNYQPYFGSTPSSETPDSYANSEDEITSNEYSTSSRPPTEQRPSDLSSSSLLVENLSDTVVTTAGPSFSSGVFDSYDIQNVQNDEPKFSPAVEPKSYDDSTSIKTPLSVSQPENYENYEDEIVTNPLPTSLPPLTDEQPSVELSDEVAIYNVRQPSTAYPLPSVNYDESSSLQPTVAPQSQPDNYVSYDDERFPNQIPSTSSPQPEDNQYLEYSDQLAVYNVREPLPGTTTSSPIVESSIQPSPQSDNYMNYETEVVSNQTPTTSSPQPEQEQYVEYSDQLAVYNVREPLPGTTTSSPIVESSIQPSSSQSDINESSEDEVISQPSTTSSPKLGEDQYVEYSDQLAVYNVREPLPSTTTSSPVVNVDFLNSAVTTSSSFYKSDNFLTQDTTAPAGSQSTSAPLYDETYDETKTTQSSFDSQPDSYEDYEGQFQTTIPPSQNIKTPNLNIMDITSAPSLTSVEYDPYDSQADYTDTQTTVPTELTSQMSKNLTTVQPLTSSESQPEQYENYEDERMSTTLPTSTSSTNQVEPSVEYSDDLAVYNVREPILEPTSPPLVSGNVLRNLATTLSPSSSLSLEPASVQPSSSELQSDSDDDYEDESNESPTTPSIPVRDEPSVELSDELAVYNVREPLSGTTISSPIVESSIQPSSQSDNYMNYETEVVSNQTPTTSSPQPEQEQYVEYSDQLAVYNVREPLLEATSPPVISENIPNSIVTTLSPSSFESQSDDDDDYENESNESPTTPSTPIQVQPSVELSDELAVYNVRQPEYSSSLPPAENLANDLVTTVGPSSDFETYDNQVVYTDFQPTFSPQSDSQVYSSSESQTDTHVNYGDKMVSNVAVSSASPPVDVDVEYSDELAIYNVPQLSTVPPLMRGIATIPPSSVPESNSHVTASNVPTTLSPFIQTTVQSEQDDFYTYDDGTQSSDTQTTFSPETPTTSKPQPILQTMVTTFQPLTESQINKKENKTSTPSKQQEVSTFPPLYPFIPLNQPSYPMPVESQLVSEQQNQLISNQVVNSPLVPSSELDSGKRSNNLSNLETRPTDGVENIQRDTPQPEPFALVPDQSNPSNEPGEEYVSCTCTRGNGRATQHTLMCPFNPVLKGNMTAPSYYILISKLSGDSGNQSLPDEERFQVEKVYLGDGTPLNCTEESKTFPTSKYTPIPISSSRTVKLPIRLNNA